MIGRRLTPLLVDAGHQVCGTTRSEGRAEIVRGCGGEPVVVDVYDAAALREAVVAFAPDVVMHQLTDLPDDAAQIPERRESNARMREVGTKNLVDAARAAGASRFIAQSIAWDLPPEMASRLEEHERMVHEFPGVGIVLRYGQFYGPGTYYEAEPPDPPRIQIDAAACQTVSSLEAESGVVEIVDA